MNIQYYGHACFKITTKPAGRGQTEVNIFIDPFDKKIGLRPPQGQADLVLVTHGHDDHNNVDSIKGEPAIISIPGEYSVKGVNIIGLSSMHGPVAQPVPNAIYVLESEDLKICHLGDVDLNSDLADKQLEEIDGVDILMVPAAGGYPINYKKAVELVKKIEPKIIIPMHYKMSGTVLDIDDERKFCAEIGNCPEERIARLNIKKKDLEEKNMEVMLMGIE